MRAVKKPTRLALAEALTRFMPPVIAQRIRSKVFPLGLAMQSAYPFRKRAVTGSILMGSTSDYFFWGYSVQGYNNWRLWACAAAICQPGDRIIEVGANVGTETVGFSDIVGASGEVVAFEPYPPNFAILEEALRHVRHQNIRLMQQALADEDRTFVFTVPSKANSGIGHIAFGAEQPEGRQVEVIGKRLDSLQTELGGCSLLMMDAEGSEIFILRGGRDYIARYAPVIIVEADAPNNLKRLNLTLRDLYDELVSQQYIVRKIGKLRLEAIDFDYPHLADWVAVPEAKQALLGKISRFILRSALLPPLPGLSPLAR
jgi:FkbM family methyltransferase